MYYVYLLKSPKTDQISVGFTENLRQRYRDHQKLPRRAGWILIYYEAYRDRQDAVDRERKLKNYGSSLHGLKRRLRGSLNLRI